MAYGYQSFGGATPLTEQTPTVKALLVSGVVTLGVAVVVLFSYMNEMNKVVPEADKAKQEKTASYLLYVTVVLAVIGGILLYFYSETKKE